MHLPFFILAILWGQAPPAAADTQTSQEKEAARKAGTASTVTRSGSVSPSELTQLFQTQTGQSVRFAKGLHDSALAVNWKDTPFWTAVGELELAAGAIATGDRADQALVLRPRSDDANPSVARSGPCRVEIVRHTLRPNLVDPSQAILQVRWRVRTEPRLRPLYVVVADADCSLTDGQKTFPPLSPDARRDIPGDRWEGSELDTAFEVPKDIPTANLAVTLAGEVKVAAIPLLLTFTDLDRPNPAVQQRGAATGKLGNLLFLKDARSFGFELTLNYDRGGPEFESHRLWIYQNAAWLEHKTTGQRIRPSVAEFKETTRTGGVLGFGFDDFEGQPADYRFVYEAPSLIIGVPFRVDQLTLVKAGGRRPEAGVK